MNSKSYLLFRCEEQQYGLEADLVQEVFLIPELQPIMGDAKCLIGLLNWRSQLVPVTHLNLQFNQSFEQCKLTNQLIVVRWRSSYLGIVTDEVIGVQSIDHSTIDINLKNKLIDDEYRASFLVGLTQIDQQAIKLLNVDSLAIYSPAKMDFSQLNTEELDSTKVNLNNIETAAVLEKLLTNLQSDLTVVNNKFYDRFFPQVTAKDQAVLKKRAENIATNYHSQDTEKLLSLVVIKLQEQYLGLNMEIVKEFVPIAKIQSIPKCPPAIVGNMNCHGEVLTIIDLAKPLKLDQNIASQPTEVVVIEWNDIIAGVAVDQVMDVFSLKENMIQFLSSSNNIYGQKITEWQGEKITIIDLEKILTKEVLKI